ncbi:hypothetical protein CN116_03835 [Sinorhizobium meliloti]|uniref:Rhodanese-like domain-containing protein n=1 Tax=Rhizobium meliloti TaxID=382 RepID=A0A6A7ZN77_RHIML|nr:hypothetical protein [Sinorhizobium meliloti]MDW9669582.1 hypothetical protein [Sinorhizobium meliloti]MDW9956788.1 hypothetical protein [Sinorhizobium meliloti]MDX0135841.1 hypothetical protein [Sinorhizobium meliloti]MDX0379158.1 hypothetical protein [Sinorhizobium meliloti]MQV21429.1 hypothetical protein [Sinorhizobium meliloti]
MSTLLEISPEKLARFLGTPNCPVLIDVRVDEDFDADAVLIPGSVRRDHRELRIYADGNEQFEAGLLLYDAFCRWCRDATDEIHTWPSPKKGAWN